MARRGGGSTARVFRRSSTSGSGRRGYLVAEAPGAVVLVDQHAAHERVLFDRTLRRLEKRQPSSQLLLIPHVLDVTPGQVAAFQEHEAWLRTLGFEDEFVDRLVPIKDLRFCITHANFPSQHNLERCKRLLYPTAQRLLVHPRP